MAGVGNLFHIKGHFNFSKVLRGPYHYEHITKDEKKDKKSLTAVLLSLMFAAFLDSPNVMAGTVFL